MKLSMGIVGLPNVGKSTLFKVLTKQDINIANYPFATIDPNIGVVAVPDERLEKLNEMSKSAKKIPAVVEFYDIAGLVKGASSGEGLGNQFLANIRETNAIVQVVRCFKEEDVIHVESNINPERDIDIINLELIFKDLETVEKRIGSLEKEARVDKKKTKSLEIIKKLKAELLADKLANSLTDEIKEEPAVRELNLLTLKPQIYLLNGEVEDVPESLKEKIKSLGANYLIFNLALADDVDNLIKKSYKVLGLISFFTTGEDETRAWTIKRGSLAPVAAGTIHTDFENKFIRAEVINYEEFISLGSWQEAKQKGKLRLEGKEYEVQDGDILEIRHG